MKIPPGKRSSRKKPEPPPFENPVTGVDFSENCHRDVPEVPRFLMAAVVLSAGTHFKGPAFFSVLVPFKSTNDAAAFVAAGGSF